MNRGGYHNAEKKTAAISADDLEGRADTIVVAGKRYIAGEDGKFVSASAGKVSSERFVLYYSVNDISISRNYLDNETHISKILYHLGNSPRIDSIVVYAFSSPEGPFNRNKWLAERRAAAARDFLIKSLPEGSALKPENIIMRPVPENWEGLRAAVEEKYTGVDKNKILEILDADIPDETRKTRLKKLNGGRTWRILIRDYMKPLRLATWVCTWVEVEPFIRPEIEAPEPLGDIPQDTLVQTFTIPQMQMEHKARQAQRTFLAAKTNLLYDAATVINFDIEVPINKHFSLMYEHLCPWWLSKSNRNCLQFLSMGGEARWWFLPRTRDWNHPDVLSGKYKQRDALCGHFLGVYASGGKADIQASLKGCYQFEYFSAGLTYGYSLPISKSLNMEFSISAGYARVPYRHYNPSDDWELLVRDPDKVGTMHWFGPTKVKVSLVVPIRMKTKSVSTGSATIIPGKTVYSNGKEVGND